MELPQRAELYRYKSLGPNPAFRLLLLRKGSGLGLECELVSLSLQHGTPPYEALSYAWGSNERVERIKLGGKLFWVTDNLHAALQSLRWRDEDRTLWIDAICINQGDTAEKSQQVQQMGRIYENARKVLIWLGKATPEGIVLMDTLKNYRDTTSVCRNKREVLEELPSFKDLTTGLQQLLHREWFTRVWILQEVAKARKANVCCGTRSIAAEIFARAPTMFGQKPPPHCQPVLDMMTDSTRTSSRRAQTSDLRNLVRNFQASKATDERDKIFALLGMSTDPLDMRSLRIDYQRPTSKVVYEAVTHLLDSTYNRPSKPFAINEALNLMSHFTTLEVTYFASAQGLSADAIYPHLLSVHESSGPYEPEIKSPTTAFVIDPTRLLFEERPARYAGTQETCYSQVVQLMQNEQSKRLRENDEEEYMRVYQWRGVENHVKVMIIHDKARAVLQAAMRGYVSFVRQLLHMQLGIYKEEGFEASVLHKAAYVGSQKMIETLLKAGAAVNAQGGEYSNALQAASYRGHEKVVAMLLNKNANVNAQGGKYSNALQAAALNSSVEVVEMLLKAGAAVNAQGGEYGNALQAASYRGYEKVVAMLLDKNADVNAQGGEYGNALQAAALDGSVEIVETLLKAGAAVNAQGGEYGNALQAASYRGHEKVVAMLLDKNADVNAQGGEYGNALQAASYGGHEKVVAMLRQAAADQSLGRSKTSS